MKSGIQRVLFEGIVVLSIEFTFPANDEMLGQLDPLTDHASLRLE